MQRNGPEQKASASPVIYTFWAEERKITNNELKAAVQFFKNMVNWPDFTKQKFKQLVNQGRQK